MFKAKEKIYIIVYRIIDIIIVGISFLIAFNLRKNISFPFLEPFHENIGNYLWHLIMLLFIWGQLLCFNKVYLSYRGKPVKKVIFAVMKANIQGLLLFGFVLFFAKAYWIHRTLIIIFFLICSVLLILEKIILFGLLHQIRKCDKNLKQVLIVGTGNKAKQIVNLFRTSQGVGFKVVGLLGNNADDVGKNIDGATIIGLSTDLLSILHQHVIDEVLISISIRHISKIKKMILECEQFGINARIMEQIYNPGKASVYMDEFLGISFITFTTKSLKIYQRYIKNIFDIMVALVLIIFLMPIFLIIAILIKMDSKGPALFKQERAATNGRKFIMYKFRSMIDGAESQRVEIEEFNEIEGPIFKMRNDPRITRVGKFLRKTSFDELPQLFNVLKRDISLIGPRPLPVYETEQITGLARRRLSMKPGITGLWQVNGRNEVNYDKLIEFDLTYIDNWSLWLDAKILFKTLFVWLSGKGAY